MRGGIYHESEAQGISRWLRLYFIVYLNLSHNKDILNYNSNIDLPGRKILEELILCISLSTGPYGEKIAQLIEQYWRLKFNITMFSNLEYYIS